MEDSIAKMGKAKAPNGAFQGLPRRVQDGHLHVSGHFHQICDLPSVRRLAVVSHDLTSEVPPLRRFGEGC